MAANINLNDNLLDEIEAAADNVKLIKKEVQNKRQKKSEIPLKFDIDESDGISLKMNLVRYINSKDYTYQDLFDFCIKYSNDEKEGKRLGYSIIAGLKEKRNIRADTIDILCRFLNVDVILAEKVDDGKERDIK